MLLNGVGCKKISGLSETAVLSSHNANSEFVPSQFSVWLFAENPNDNFWSGLQELQLFRCMFSWCGEVFKPVVKSFRRFVCSVSLNSQSYIYNLWCWVNSHRGRGRACTRWWRWWCRRSWPSARRSPCRWSGRGRVGGGRSSTGHRNSRTGERSCYYYNLSAVSHQDDNPHWSDTDEKFVEVGEDVPLEGGDGSQEAAGKFYIKRVGPAQELFSLVKKFFVQSKSFVAMEYLRRTKRRVVEAKAKAARRIEAIAPNSIQS